MDQFFYPRLDDLADRASKGEIAIGDFMNPAEQYAAKKYYDSLGVGFILYGGYDEAERKLAAVLPWYMTFDSKPEETVALSEYIIPLRIASSGYVNLSHRDYMGALLGCGIERAKVGDICPDEDGAVVFAREGIAGFLTSDEKPLTRVGRDTVKISRISLPDNFDGGRSYASLSGTAASDRLDCAIAALTTLSREKAKEEIRAGAVAVNFEEALEPDTRIFPGDTLSVHGFGRFVVKDCTERTRKDRIRVEAVKYV